MRLFELKIILKLYLRYLLYWNYFNLTKSSLQFDKVSFGLNYRGVFVNFHIIFFSPFIYFDILYIYLYITLYKFSPVYFDYTLTCFSIYVALFLLITEVVTNRRSLYHIEIAAMIGNAFMQSKYISWLNGFKKKYKYFISIFIPCMMRYIILHAEPKTIILCNLYGSQEMQSCCSEIWVLLSDVYGIVASYKGMSI